MVNKVQDRSTREEHPAAWLTDQGRLVRESTKQAEHEGQG